MVHHISTDEIYMWDIYIYIFAKHTRKYTLIVILLIQMNYNIYLGNQALSHNKKSQQV